MDFTGASVYSYALQNSVNDMLISRTCTEKKSADTANFISAGGDIYLPLSNLNEDIEEGKVRANIEDTRKKTRMLSTREFRRDFLEDDIITLDYNKTTFLPTLIKDVLKSKSTYGILIQNGDYIINPGHPLVAFLISVDLLELPTDGKMHIFNWKEQVAKKRLFKKAKENTGDFYATIFNELGYLIKTFKVDETIGKVATETLTSLNQEPFIDTLTSKIKITSKATDTKTESAKALIIPLQILASNIVTPYYGVGYVSNPRISSRIGRNITPMFTGNFGAEYTTNDEQEYYYDQYSQGGGNVCVGSYNAASSDGWSTLSRVTTNDMYYKEIMREDTVWEFAESSKRIAASIWKDIEKESLNLDEI